MLQGTCAIAGTIPAVLVRWLATSAGSPSQLYETIYTYSTKLHIHQREMPGRGGWPHPPDKHVGSIRGGIYFILNSSNDPYKVTFLPSTSPHSADTDGSVLALYSGGWSLKRLFLYGSAALPWFLVCWTFLSIAIEVQRRRR